MCVCGGKIIDKSHYSDYQSYGKDNHFFVFNHAKPHIIDRKTSRHRPQNLTSSI